ncbi:M24 family metallopeptidase [Microbacterium sp. NPDC076895]|uniref:M24 family metallopeptidase n=1 Tax=Microbacterium sp. NPDC076895 TaxID=3154957 RepID=UPI00341FC2F6
MDVDTALTRPFDHVARRARLYERLDAEGIEVLFLPADQADFEYYLGIPRRAPSFGAIAYTNHWISGAFLAPGREPLLVLTRHFQEFDLPDGVEGDLVTATETDDGRAVFTAAFDRFPGTRVGVTSRTWAEVGVELARHRPGIDLIIADPVLAGIRAIKDDHEIALMRRAAHIADEVLREVTPLVVPGMTEIELASEVELRMRRHGSTGPSFDTGVWGMGPHLGRDASVRVSTDALTAGTGVSFDYGAIVRGYCSDFGRTVHIGEPSAEYERVHAIVMAAQEAARVAAVPGATGGQAHKAARAVIDDAGYGEGFRHRVGHCIGLDVHEHPFLSAEDNTPLRPGMLFTLEPSIFLPGRVGVRVEDVFLLTETGAESINTHPHDLLATGR